MELTTALWILLIVLALPVLLDLLGMCSGASAGVDPAASAQKQKVRDNRLLRLCGLGLLLVLLALVFDWTLGTMLGRSSILGK